jgi:hypothetical protein
MEQWNEIRQRMLVTVSGRHGNNEEAEPRSASRWIQSAQQRHDAAPELALV